VLLKQMKYRHICECTDGKSLIFAFRWREIESCRY